MSSVISKIYRYILFINKYLFKINERINEILFEPLTISGPLTVNDATTTRCSIAGNSVDLSGGLGVALDLTVGNSLCLLGHDGCLDPVNGGTCDSTAALSVLNGGAYFHKSICVNHQVVANSGSLQKPAYTFCHETSSGFERLQPRTISASITGTEVLRITPASVELPNEGSGLRLNPNGPNATVGQATFSTNQSITVNSGSVISGVGITSFIFITPVQTSGTLSITNISSGNFTVTSTSPGETGSVFWLIINPIV